MSSYIEKRRQCVDVSASWRLLEFLWDRPGAHIYNITKASKPAVSEIIQQILAGVGRPASRYDRFSSLMMFISHYRYGRFTGELGWRSSTYKLRSSCLRGKRVLVCWQYSRSIDMLTAQRSIDMLTVQRSIDMLTAQRSIDMLTVQPEYWYVDSSAGVLICWQYSRSIDMLTVQPECWYVDSTAGVLICWQYSRSVDM